MKHQHELIPLTGSEARRGQFGVDVHVLGDRRARALAASDIMLGWIRTTEWIDGVNRDFYVRQLWDGKGSAPVDVLDPDALGRYGELCG